MRMTQSFFVNSIDQLTRAAGSWAIAASNADGRIRHTPRCAWISAISIIILMLEYWYGFHFAVLRSCGKSAIRINCRFPLPIVEYYSQTLYIRLACVFLRLLILCQLSCLTGASGIFQLCMFASCEYTVRHIFELLQYSRYSSTC